MSLGLPTIIYAFDEYHLDNSKVDTYLKLHKISTEMVSKLGYTTELYTNSYLFDSFFDKIHRTKDVGIFWDGFKILPYTRDDDYLVIDSDVFIHNKILFNKNVDFYFDSWESWGKYDSYIKILTDMGIEKVIPEWSYTKQKVMNTGLLYFNNKNFKNLYYEKYKVYCNFCIDNIIQLKKYNKFQMFGTIGTQYLLTILSNYYNQKHHNFSVIRGVKNKYYQHMVGPDKFNINFQTKSSII